MIGFGWTELVLMSVVVISVAAVALGVALRSTQRRAVGSGETPSLPPPRQPAAPTVSHMVVHVHGGTSLAAQLREHANAAELAKLRPFLEFGAVWCPPSRLFGNSLEDPRMQAALRGIYLIRAELDDFASDPYTRELRASAVPAFYELDADGRWTGRQINGGAWGVDTIENMSRTMTGFFAG